MAMVVIARLICALMASFLAIIVVAFVMRILRLSCVSFQQGAKYWPIRSASDNLSLELPISSPRL
jgi:hypothetical protein